jgi:hypothetical protein
MLASPITQYIPIAKQDDPSGGMSDYEWAWMMGFYAAVGAIVNAARRGDTLEEILRGCEDLAASCEPEQAAEQFETDLEEPEAAIEDTEWPILIRL